VKKKNKDVIRLPLNNKTTTTDTTHHFLLILLLLLLRLLLLLPWVVVEANVGWVDVYSILLLIPLRLLHSTSASTMAPPSSAHLQAPSSTHFRLLLQSVSYKPVNPPSTSTDTTKATPQTETHQITQIETPQITQTPLNVNTQILQDDLPNVYRFKCFLIF